MSRRFRVVTAVLLVAVTAAFGIYVLPGVPGVPRSQAELKFAVIARTGDPMVCTGWGVPNPPFSPLTEYPRIVADVPTYLAILHHTDLPPTPLTDDQIVTVYRAWLNLEAVQLTWRGGYYDFVLFPGPRSSALEKDTEGKVDLLGRVYDVHEGDLLGACPICLAAGMHVATPRGPMAVERIEAGMAIWTIDSQGRRVQAVVVRVVSRRDVPGSTLIHLTLGDGRALIASAVHRLSDGRMIGSLEVGDAVDGVRVTRVDLVFDRSGWTYDVLPSGETGDYWVDGILLESTLRADPTTY